MATAGSDHAALRRALKARDYESACTYARSLPVVPLDAALDLTLLAAEKKPERFEDLARRWLVRWMEEMEPGLPEIQLTIAQLRAAPQAALDSEHVALGMSRLHEGD
jgi:hypothetical protein